MFKFKKPSLRTVAAASLGLFAAVVSVLLAQALVAHMLGSAIFAAVGFTFYTKMARDTWKDVKKPRDLFV